MARHGVTSPVRAASACSRAATLCANRQGQHDLTELGRFSVSYDERVGLFASREEDLLFPASCNGGRTWTRLGALPRGRCRLARSLLPHQRRRCVAGAGRRAQAARGAGPCAGIDHFDRADRTDLCLRSGRHPALDRRRPDLALLQGPEAPKALEMLLSTRRLTRSTRRLESDSVFAECPPRRLSRPIVRSSSSAASRCPCGCSCARGRGATARPSSRSSVVWPSPWLLIASRWTATRPSRHGRPTSLRGLEPASRGPFSAGPPQRRARQPATLILFDVFDLRRVRA